jgi:sialate O-acetylesterase
MTCLTSCVIDSFDASTEISEASQYPNIRVFIVGQNTCSPQTAEPLDDLSYVYRSWSVGSSETVNQSWAASAVCWDYGRRVYDDVIHQSYPIGLVMSDWGGTTVQAWAPQSVTDACVGTSITKSFPHANPDKPFHTQIESCEFNPNAVAALYNTMIYPFRAMAFKGGLWYQGETDSWQPQNYACLQNGMLDAWRQMWGSNFAFIFTQLSTWNSGGDYYLPNFRTMQESILTGQSLVEMVTAADLGDPYSTSGEIHPRNKSEIGRRMSYAASGLMYGKPFPHRGPIVQSVNVVSDATYGYRVEISFSSGTADGLRLQEAQLCPDWSQVLTAGCGYPELLTSSSSVRSTVSLGGANSIVVTPNSFLSSRPVSIYYGQGDYPMMTVYNGIGAPLLPFIAQL